jgi:hypothetical protein
MSDTHDQSGQKSDEQKQQDLFNELNKLGQQLETAARAALESDQSRSFQRDLSAGMKEFFGQLQNAAKTAQQDERLQNLAERGQQAWGDVQERVQENKAMQDLQVSMARGIAYLNMQLGEFTERMQKEQQAGAQQVPIEEEEEQTTADTARQGTPGPATPGAPSTPPPAAPTTPPPSTGPTVRLDDETDEQK